MADLLIWTITNETYVSERNDDILVRVARHNSITTALDNHCFEVLYRHQIIYKGGPTLVYTEHNGFVQ